MEAFKIVERTQVGGIEVKVKNQAKVRAAYKRLGGRCGSVSDKGAVLSFPSRQALDEYVALAKKNGAIFDSAEGWD